MFNPKCLKHKGKNLKTSLDFSEFSQIYSPDKFKKMVDYFIKREFEINEDIRNLVKKIEEKNNSLENLRLKMSEENQNSTQNFTQMQEQFDKELEQLFNLLLKLRSAYNNATRSIHKATFDFAREARRISSVFDYEDFSRQSDEIIQKDNNFEFKIINKNFIEVSFNGLISERNYERDDLLTEAIYNGLQKIITQNKEVLSSFSQLYVCIEQYVSDVKLQHIRDTDKINFGGILNAVVQGVCWSDSSNCLNIFTQTYQRNDDIVSDFTKILIMTPEEFFKNYIPKTAEKSI